MADRFKRLIQRAFNGLGYEVRRIRPAAPPVIEVVEADASGDLTVASDVPELNTATDEAKFIVTESLYAKIPADALEDFRQLVAKKPSIYPNLATDGLPHRRRETLRLGNYHLPEKFNAATGLSNFTPPDDVHAMVRAVEFCGDLYYCDLVAEVLARTGLGFQAGGRYLDFGCSSGRVVRTLAAEYRDAQFLGCDPNSRAIEWASKEMPHIDFFVSPERPPLPLGAESLDGAYAISIWSHFSAEAALLWLDEMFRIIKPGGFLVITTHGYGSLIHYHEIGGMASKNLEAAKRDLDRHGFHFVDVFGADGDWGVGKSDWGDSFVNPAFLLKHLSPRWTVADFMTRRAESNQDVYLLRRAN